MPKRSALRNVPALAAVLAVIACASGQTQAQASGNTTRARPTPVDSVRPRPAVPAPTPAAPTPPAAASAAAPATPAAAPAAMTTALGIFTGEQAARGKDTYLTNCVSCHKPTDHTGGGFWTDLVGKTVGEFFKYLKENMPQDNPGAIADTDYANVVAYMLQLNGVPVGDKPLLPDTTLLNRIRIVSPN